MTTAEMQPSMGRTATTKERRPIVARLHLRHQKPTDILRALQSQGIQCDKAQITRDIQFLEAQWRQALIEDPVAQKAKEWAEIEEAEAECWINYANTRDPRWLTELRGWKERKAKLLGLDAPAKQEVAVVLATLADVAKRRAELEANGHSDT